ncbi:hypothetical protein AB5R26_004101 [Enterobacter mori]
MIKTNRPIIAAILSLLLLLKLISALGFMYQTTGFAGPVVGLQMILITFSVYTLNTKAGGQASLITMVGCLFFVMVLDGVLINISLNGRVLPEETIPRVIGAELTYILTIAYVFFSKKLRRFKEINI